MERSATALEQGDWHAYFDARIQELPPEVQQEFIAGNDPVVAAAIVRTSLLQPSGFVMPVVPTLAYWADGEIFASRNAKIAEAFPLDWTVIEGSHSDGFVMAEAVARIVAPFVDAAVNA